MGLSMQQRCDAIVDALTRLGPLGREDLQIEAGLTEGQFGDAWFEVKRQWAGVNGKVVGVDPATWLHGLFDANTPEAWRVLENRLGDALTRLLTIERGQLDAMLVAGEISKRLHRALVMAREEYEDRGGLVLQQAP